MVSLLLDRGAEVDAKDYVSGAGQRCASSVFLWSMHRWGSAVSAVSWGMGQSCEAWCMHSNDSKSPAVQIGRVLWRDL